MQTVYKITRTLSKNNKVKNYEWTTGNIAHLKDCYNVLIQRSKQQVNTIEEFLQAINTAQSELDAGQNYNITYTAEFVANN